MTRYGINSHPLFDAAVASNPTYGDIIQVSAEQGALIVKECAPLPLGMIALHQQGRWVMHMLGYTLSWPDDEPLGLVKDIPA